VHNLFTVPRPFVAENFLTNLNTAQRVLAELEALHLVVKEGKTKSSIYRLNDAFRTFPENSGS
jgi:hypothetical protein